MTDDHIKRLMKCFGADRFQAVTYDAAYQIMPNGDIITSDGKPRGVCQVQLKMVAEQAAKEGRVIEWRFVKADDRDV